MAKTFRIKNDMVVQLFQGHKCILLIIYMIVIRVAVYESLWTLLKTNF